MEKHTSQKSESELTQVNDSELGELCNSLNIVADWLRVRMREHLDPENADELLLKSEQDISEMIEAYFGNLFHYLIQLSDRPTEPLNTSVVNQDVSRQRMRRLKKKFGLTDEYFESSPIDHHLKRLRKLFTSTLIGPQIVDHQNDKNHVWAGGHLWLERRFATGYRLLFLEAEQWNLPRASWAISRVVHDWPHTFTRTILREFRPNRTSYKIGETIHTPQICTAICAFNDVAEKECFEETSGLREGQYLYLWAGDSISDFNNADLVWFRDPGKMHPDESLKGYVLPKVPVRALGLDSEVRARWSILRDEWEKGLSAKAESEDETLDFTLVMRFVYERNLLRDIYRELEEKDQLGHLSEDHWLKRNTKFLRQILRKESHPIRNTFWAIQSVMFYDWKYWYMFPFNYEGSPSGGFALSSASPLTEGQIKHFATIINELLRVFAETEEWARNHLRQKKEINLQRAAERVHAEWARRGKKGESIKVHETLFRNLSSVVLEPKYAESLKHLKDSDPLSTRLKFLYETWEEQIRNIDYSVVNYWSAPEPNRVFAEWLSPCLGEGAKERWKKVWSVYKHITEVARKEFKYYTFNDYLFDKAPRKAILEWRGYNWQIVPRGQDNPKDWVAEPPSITPDVALILFKGLKFDYENESIDVGKYIYEIERRIDQIKEFLVEHAESYSNKLADFIATNKLIELGIYKGDLGSLQKVLGQLKDDAKAIKGKDKNDDLSDIHTSQKRLSAEYLVRLAIYLNVQMNTMEEGFEEGIFLGLYRCAFLSWALFQHYSPERFRSSTASDQSNRQSPSWYFYSIPVHIPLVEKEEASRTSILSLGTTIALTGDDLKGWAEIGKEIVLPALMIDLSKEVKEREYERLRAGLAVGLYHQLAQVLASTRSRGGILKDAGGELLKMAEQLESMDDMDQEEFEPYKEKYIKQWKENDEIFIARLKRAQMFRDFAYAQLNGTVSENKSAPAIDVAREAFEIAKEYLFNLRAPVTLVLDSSLEKIRITEDAYGFILQELIANAYRSTSELPDPCIRISVVKQEGSSFLEVRNSIAEETYKRLKDQSLDFNSPPGPEQQSGRGLFGIHCLFSARGIKNAPSHQLTRKELAILIPVIDF